MSENIINGPIVEGCFVRLRNGVEIGWVQRAPNNFVPQWLIEGIGRWYSTGTHSGGMDDLDITEVLVLSEHSAAPVEPSYEQKLWDEVAKETCGVNVSKGLLNPARAAAETANIFMAERAKRMVK
jgi:hypothetical protein